MPYVFIKAHFSSDGKPTCVNCPFCGCIDDEDHNFGPEYFCRYLSIRDLNVHLPPLTCPVHHPAQPVSNKEKLLRVTNSLTKDSTQHFAVLIQRRPSRSSVFDDLDAWDAWAELHECGDRE